MHYYMYMIQNQSFRVILYNMLPRSGLVWKFGAFNMISKYGNPQTWCEGMGADKINKKLACSTAAMTSDNRADDN